MKRRALQIALIALLSLLLAEALLQVGGALTRHWMQRGPESAGGDGEIVVLCIGDSHTYGLPLTEAESYPSQLRVALERRHPNRDFVVANLGIPSLNSAFVANRLERQMAQFHPDVVIVWVGVNNRWNVVETGTREGESRWSVLRRALMVSRLFRIASIAWYTRTGHQYDPAKRGGWYDGELPPSGSGEGGAGNQDLDPGLAADLERMARIADAAGTPILFVSYPLHPDNGLNRTIAETGRRLRVPVIDTSAVLRGAIGRGRSIDELIDTRKGPHPSALLYGYVVSAMLPVVEEAVASWSGIDLRAPAAPE